jgi:ribonucleoside-diphosphate reductase alpha chain
MSAAVEYFDEWFESLTTLKEELQNAETTEFEDSFSEEVWRTTYKDHSDETISDTIYRVASAAAQVEPTLELQREWTTNFYQMLSQFRSTAGGRIYSNIGTEWKGTTLMNCFVAPRQEFDVDSLDSILSNLRNQSQTLKAEGGWGENFSYIRPRGAFIHGIGVETPGAVKYMEMFDKASEIITAGSGRKSKNKKAKGKIRKGAMMGVLDVWHPDIIEFITAKQNAGRLTKFNISVNCTDEFMEKVLRLDEEDGDWELRFPDTQHPNYRDEWDGHLGHWEEKGYPTITYNTVKVSYLWNLIMESTYNRAEPGVLFLDRANHFSPLSYKETIQATNPCGEQTLAPGGVCNLGSINLASFVKDDGFDLDGIARQARFMVRFLDNINEISEAPLPEYEFSMKNKRRIGVGILGWGSALFMLRVRFGSQRAQELREQVMETIAQNAYMASIDLAEEKGMFSLCDPEKHAENPFIQNLGLSSDYMNKLREVGIRNSS